MAFQVSPGVNVSEIDLTTIIPAVSTTTGAFAGHYSWGPAGIRVLVDSEDTLVNTFGKPISNTASDFFTAANFLAYGNSLYVARVIRSSNASTLSTDTVVARNAVSNTLGFLTSSNTKNTIIKNEDDYNQNYYAAGISNVGPWVGKYPGSFGNNIRISVCPTANAYESTLSGSLNFVNNSVSVSGSSTAFTNQITVGDIILCGPDKVERKVARVANATSLILQSAYVGNTVTNISNITRRWEFFNNVGGAPGTSKEVGVTVGSSDEMHIIVADRGGQISGFANTVLEVFEGVSKASGARSENGTNIYYKDYVKQNSKWIWWTSHLTGITNIGKAHTSGAAFGAGSQSRPINTNLCLGRDGAAPRETDYINGYNLFKSAEDVDVSLILGGASTPTRATHIINNIAEYRRDCVAVLSPRQADVVNNSGYPGAELDDIVAFRNSLPSTSYAVLDSGWKYQYDKYTDLFRYVPLNVTQQEQWFALILSAILGSHQLVTTVVRLRT
jgi:hypothetical protein